MESSEATSGVEVGPALGMKFRHAVRGHAMEEKYPGWNHVLRHMSQSELASVIGDARTEAQAIEQAKAWAVSF